jgi:hypothetical protein
MHIGVVENICLGVHLYYEPFLFNRQHAGHSHTKQRAESVDAHLVVTHKVRFSSEKSAQLARLKKRRKRLDRR